MRRTAVKVLTMLLCVGMLMSMSGAVLCANAAFIEGKSYDRYTYQEYMDLTKKEKVTFFNGFPGGVAAFNRWYNAAKKAADEEKVVVGDTIDLGQLLKVEATIGDKKYANFTEALGAAVSGDTIVLAADVRMDSVLISEGVTLDLAGKTLTVESFGFKPEMIGKIIDSAEESKGLLKVAAEDAAFHSADAFAQNTLPIYDSANGGYRFYTYTYGNATVEKDAQVAGTAKFWYQIQFEDTDAYELMYAGNSGVKTGMDVDYAGAEESTSCLFKKDGSEDAWTKSYGAFVLGYDDGSAVQNPWLWVRVQNADSVTDLTLTPYITAGGVDIYFKPIPYNAQ